MGLKLIVAAAICGGLWYFFGIGPAAGSIIGFVVGSYDPEDNRPSLL